MKKLFQRLSNKLHLRASTPAKEAGVDAAPGLTECFTRMAESAMQLREAELREFLTDRLTALHNRANEPEQWVLPAVDFLDELGALEDYTAADLAILAELAEGLQAALAGAGAELLSPPQWDPALQRAVKVNFVLESNAEPEVVKTFATGVKLGERLLRKQEVELNMPSSPSH